MDHPLTDIRAWLGPHTWARANRELLAKALTELRYEEVLALPVDASGRVSLELGRGVLGGRAELRALGWWRVDPASLTWDAYPEGRDGDSDAPDRAGGDTPHRSADAPLPDAPELLAEILTGVGVAPPTVANMVSELSSTLLSDAWQLARGRSSSELADLEPVLVESELRGHPWIVANKGRVGFDTDDVFAYAPEAGHDVRLLWLAAAPSIADTSSLPGLDHRGVVREQVGDDEFQRLRAQAQLAGLDPDVCIYVPVHPWQWTNRVLPLHAGELARGQLVLLGEGRARYRPQLAIRTVTDAEHPERRYLKLPVSVLNTSVYRGLPRERALAAPALTEWLAGVVSGDPFLRETGVILLGEVASVSLAHPTYEALPDVPYQHTEMLGAIWRDPVQPRLEPGEQAVSLAALLHVDTEGEPFVGALVKRSGLGVDEWVQRLHHAVLPPLLHVLYRYGAMFSPHGQNCMIAHRNGMPTRLVVKDFVDDVAICSEPLPEHDGMTQQVRAALADVTIESGKLVKYLQNGLLICVYRYLAEITDDRLGLPEAAFWSMAREELVRYQRRFTPELADRFRRFHMETETFPKLCLNRLRLLERGYADDAERPVISAVGEVRNPLAPGAW